MVSLRCICAWMHVYCVWPRKYPHTGNTSGKNCRISIERFTVRTFKRTADYLIYLIGAPCKRTKPFSLSFITCLLLLRYHIDGIHHNSHHQRLRHTDVRASIRMPLGWKNLAIGESFSPAIAQGSPAVQGRGKVFHCIDTFVHWNSYCVRPRYGILWYTREDLRRATDGV